MKALINLDDFSEETLERMAKETKDTELLETLAKVKKEKVLCAVAENSCTELDTLEEFAKNGSCLVRRAVAGNVKIRRSTIDILFDYAIKTANYDVLFSISTVNYPVPHRDLICKIASHPIDEVRFALSWWGSYKIRDDEEILGILLDASYDVERSRRIYYNSRASTTNEATRGNIATMTKDQKKLERLSKDQSWTVQFDVVKNKSTTNEIIEEMKKALSQKMKEYKELDPVMWEQYSGYGTLHHELDYVMGAIDYRLKCGSVPSDYGCCYD